MAQPSVGRPARRCQRRAVRAMVLVTAVLIAGVAGVAGDVPPADASTCWVPPVSAPVVDPFRPPACRWCPGNRGLEYGTGPGAPVRAVASGIVTFSGRVAGTGYVVVRHADGIRATYGGLTGPFRPQGSFVPAGAMVGLTEGTLHFGLRQDHAEADPAYLDPTPFIGRVVLRARLLPLDSTAPRRGASRVVCPRRGGGSGCSR